MAAVVEVVESHIGTTLRSTRKEAQECDDTAESSHDQQDERRKRQPHRQLTEATVCPAGARVVALRAAVESEKHDCDDDGDSGRDRLLIQG